jgi:hypothetical protein
VKDHTSENLHGLITGHIEESNRFLAGRLCLSLYLYMVDKMSGIWSLKNDEIAGLPGAKS